MGDVHPMDRGVLPRLIFANINHGKIFRETQWMFFFTCLVTRNVKIELSIKMGAESFLKAYRHFVAGRAAPKKSIATKTELILSSKSTKRSGARSVPVGL